MGTGTIGLIGFWVGIVLAVFNGFFGGHWLNVVLIGFVFAGSYLTYRWPLSATTYARSRVWFVSSQLVVHTIIAGTLNLVGILLSQAV